MGIVEYHCEISKRTAKKGILKHLDSKVWDNETGSSSSSLWSSSDMGEGHRPWNEAGSDVTCVRIIVSSGLCASWLTPTPEWQCNMLGSRIWNPRNKTERSQLLAVKCSVKITEINLSVPSYTHFISQFSRHLERQLRTWRCQADGVWAVHEDITALTGKPEKKMAEYAQYI